MLQWTHNPLEKRFSAAHSTHYHFALCASLRFKAQPSSEKAKAATKICNETLVICIFMKLESQKPQNSTHIQVQWCKTDSGISEYCSTFAWKTGPPLTHSPLLSILADWTHLRPEINACLCFREVDFTLGHSPKQRLVFNLHYRSGTHRRHYVPETHLRGKKYTSFPYCFQGVIIYYSVSSTGHHGACLMSGLGCFFSIFSVCLHALRWLWMLTLKVACIEKGSKVSIIGPSSCCGSDSASNQSHAVILFLPEEKIQLSIKGQGRGQWRAHSPLRVTGQRQTQLGKTKQI